MSSGVLNIAILGASGHLGHSLSYFISETTDWRTPVFTRNPGLLATKFAGFRRQELISIHHTDDFPNGDFDIILNCVGLGDAGSIANAGAELMQTTERFDDTILKSLGDRQQGRYVAFSSGAVFGTHLPGPIESRQLAIVDPDSPSGSIGYTVAKLNSEVKHRLCPALDVVDIQLYCYFSRFQPVQGAYLMSDIVRSLSAKSALTTYSDDIVRDYIHPMDLLRLIECCHGARPINKALDAYSRAPTGKFELLDRLNIDLGLTYEISDLGSDGITSARQKFYSLNRLAHDTGYRPQFSAADAVVEELKVTIQRGKDA